MKQLFTLLLILTAHIAGYCQQVYVPYRVGNKFGLSDDSGTITLKPQFDIVQPAADGRAYFIAYNMKDTIALSSLIYNDKIIVSNQRYNGYYLNNDLFVASVYKMDRSKGYNDLSELSHLYDIGGKKIIDEDFKHISILSELNKDENTMDEVLVITIDMNNKSSLFVYDKKSKSIIKKYITKSDYLEVSSNNGFNSFDKLITIIYNSVGGNEKIIVFNAVDRKIKLISNEDVVPTDEDVSDQDRGYNDIEDIGPVEQGSYYEEPHRDSNGDTIITRIRRIHYTHVNEYEPKRIEKIEIDNDLLNKKEEYIIMRNGKVGLMKMMNKRLFIPVKYDEILNAEFPPNAIGYIVKNNDRYGLIFSDFSNFAEPKKIIIEPVFDKIPLPVSLNYLKKGFTLIKLFDENGKLFCYANKEGKLYYSAE